MQLASAAPEPRKPSKSIEEAGEKAMVLIYGENSMEIQLDLFRYQVFQRKVSTALVAEKPEDIPPTLAACKFHCWRTYFQVTSN